MGHKPTVPRICRACGKTFLAEPYRVNRGEANYCNSRCAGSETLAAASEARKARYQAEAARRISEPFLLNDSWVCRVTLSSGGGETTIDAADRGIAARYCWRSIGGYAATITKAEGKVSLHRLIMGTPAGLEVDHINGDPLDNRRANLRNVTRSQNMQNLRRARGDSKTGVRGVHWDSMEQCFRAYLTVNGKRKKVGRFPTLEAAQSAVEAGRRALMTHAPECDGSD